MQLFKLALAALMLLGSTAIHAQGTAWPGRPIRWIVPYPPGGITDNATRMVLQKVQEQTGWTIVVENKPGANSIIGADVAAKAAPDGYTFLTVIAAHAANATLYAGKLPFDTVKSFAPLSLVGIAPLIMTANNGLPVKDVKELIAYAKANPDKISFGSSGVGAAAHLTTELFKQTAGVDMVHVPYKGTAPALQDLMGGSIQILVDVPSTLMPLVRGGKIKALGMFSAKRVAGAAEVPTIAELLTPEEAEAGPPFAFWHNVESKPFNFIRPWPPSGPLEPVWRQWCRFTPTTTFDDSGDTYVRNNSPGDHSAEDELQARERRVRLHVGDFLADVANAVTAREGRDGHRAQHAQCDAALVEERAAGVAGDAGRRGVHVVVPAA